MTAERDVIRVGLHSGQQYPAFGELLDLWQTAERLGFDWISLFDHLRPPIFGADGPCLDGLTALSALAASTQRIRCALMVAPVGLRHPALLAHAASTIDQVSGGRLELGVGVGGYDLGYAQYGLPVPPLRERFEMLDETCTVLRALWSGGPVDFTGRHFRLVGAYLSPTPIQARLPLVVGGAGERRTLRVVAEHADIWNTRLLPIEEYRHKTTVLARHCVEVGRDGDEIRRSMTFRAVIAPPGDAARARDRVAAGRAAEDLAEFVSFGSAAECFDRLAPYAEAGLRDFVLGSRPPLDTGTIHTFATEVAPELRRLVTR